MPLQIVDRCWSLSVSIGI